MEKNLPDCPVETTLMLISDPIPSPILPLGYDYFPLRKERKFKQNLIEMYTCLW